MFACMRCAEAMEIYLNTKTLKLLGSSTLCLEFPELGGLMLNPVQVRYMHCDHGKCAARTAQVCSAKRKHKSVYGGQHAENT